MSIVDTSNNYTNYKDMSWSDTDETRKYFVQNYGLKDFNMPPNIVKRCIDQLYTYPDMIVNAEHNYNIRPIMKLILSKLTKELAGVYSKNIKLYDFVVDGLWLVCETTEDCDKLESYGWPLTNKSGIVINDVTNISKALLDRMIYNSYVPAAKFSYNGRLCIGKNDFEENIEALVQTGLNTHVQQCTFNYMEVLYQHLFAKPDV